MILDPQQLVTTEIDRRQAAATLTAVARRARPRRRGLTLRVAVWATGRAVQA